MDSVALGKVLRDLADEPFFPLEYEGWAKDIVPNLPKEPIDTAWLSKLLESYHSLSQATVLEHLSRLGRKEVLPVALKLSEKASGFDKLCFAGILVRLRAPRGYEMLEELYRYSLDHPDDKQNSVALDHVFDTLDEKTGFDRRKVLLRLKLVEMSNAKRNGGA
jgi:DNA-binding transcriptional ArsR family regulator